MTPYISSTSNPKIKWVKSLHKNSTRRSEGVFLVEGIKEVGFAVDGGYLLNSLFVCPDIYTADLHSFEGVEIYSISKECYEKIAYRDTTNGLIGIFQSQYKTLDELTFGDNPLFLVVESVEKPGNLGAIVRTADGVGADGVIICDPKTDIFNPNSIRASLGTIFTKQVVSTTADELHDFILKHEITTYGASLSKDAVNYTSVNLTGPSAIILGTEHDGLSIFWQERSSPVTIPMHGENDSLNVSNAAAILAYEALRQRE